MIVREAKLLNGTKEQYQALDEAIRTAQFVRNKAVRYWMDNQGVGKADLYALCKDLAKEFSFAKKLNSAARQASAERAWASISAFYTRCRKGEKEKGYPKFKKHCRSVEYAAVYPQYLRKAEKRLKSQQKRLSKKYVKGAKPQSKNYHRARKRLGKIHLKVQRQRKDWTVKLARNVVASNDVVVYEDLKVSNMVKNHPLAKSISDAGWDQFTQWLDYYGKVWDKAIVAGSPNYTSQDCSNCGHRVKKSLSTRTHSCPSCGIEICRDTNAALNILKKGMNILGMEWQNSTFGQKESGSEDRKHGEKTASAIDGQPDLVSGFL